MRTAFIVHDCNNESLLRFTQTKLFFDAKNQGINFVKHIVTVPDYASAEAKYTEGDVILETGDFLTTEFRKNHFTKYAHGNKYVIKFDKTIPINFKQRHYKPGTKQLYIVENLLKVCIRSSKLVYLDNNEGNIKDYIAADHLYGLASGWKTAQYALANNYKTITVYDYNQRQLDFAKWLHSQSELPDSVDITGPLSGIYDPSDNIRQNWKSWHNMLVDFKIIDLYNTPVFPENSLIWISNIFNYEATLFTHGYEKTIHAKNRLQKLNNNSIIVTN